MSNSISFVGRVGRDAELKTVGSTTVCEFSLANDQGFGDKKTTIWFKCHYWGKGGEAVSKYIQKGKQAWVSGELTLREYQGKDGTNKTSLEVRVDKIDLVGGKAGGQEQEQAPVQQSAPAPEPTKEEMPF